MHTHACIYNDMYYILRQPFVIEVVTLEGVSHHNIPVKLPITSFIVLAKYIILLVNYNVYVCTFNEYVIGRVCGTLTVHDPHVVANDDYVWADHQLYHVHNLKRAPGVTAVIRHQPLVINSWVSEGIVAYEEKLKAVYNPTCELNASADTIVYTISGEEAHTSYEPNTLCVIYVVAWDLKYRHAPVMNIML